MVLLVGLVLMFSLVGCGDDGDPSSPPGGNGGNGGGGKTINFLSITAHSAANVTPAGRTSHLEMQLTGTGANDLTRDNFTITPQGAVTGTLVLQQPDTDEDLFILYLSGVSSTQTVTVTISKAGYTINPPSRTIYISAGN